MSVLFRAASGCRRFFSPACAVPRLRLFFFASTAALSLTLLAAHHLATREHREARLLAVATHACQFQSALPVVFVRVPPARMRAAMKVRSNIHYAVFAVSKGK